MLFLKICNFKWTYLDQEFNVGPPDAQLGLTRHRRFLAGAGSALVEAAAGNAGASLWVMLVHGRSLFLLIELNQQHPTTISFK